MYTSVIFYIMPLLVSLFLLLYCAIGKRHKFIEFGLVFSVMGLWFIVSSFRYNVGADYFSYIELYEKVVSKNFDWNDVEPIFFIIIKLSGYLGGYEWFFSITAFLICFFIYKAIDWDEPGFYLTLILLVLFIYSLVGVRQSLSIAILLFAIKAVSREKKAKALIYMFLASLSHYSSIVAIPLYIFSFIRFNRVAFMFFMCFFVVAFLILKSSVIDLIYNVVFQTKYHVYLNLELDDRGYGLGVLLKIFLCLFFLVLLKDVSTTYRRFIYAGSFLYLLCIIVGTNIIIVNRLSLLMQVFFVNLILIFYKDKKLKDKFFSNVVLCMSVSILSFFFLMQIINGDKSANIPGGYHILPYQSILSE